MDARAAHVMDERAAHVSSVRAAQAAGDVARKWQRLTAAPWPGLSRRPEPALRSNPQARISPATDGLRGEAVPATRPALRVEEHCFVVTLHVDVEPIDIIALTCRYQGAPAVRRHRVQHFV